MKPTTTSNDAESLRICVVGLGGMGVLHAGILSALPRTRVVGIADKEARLVKLASKALPNMAFYQDALEMTDACRPDVVYVCTPAGTHFELARAILSLSHKPKGLFIEKPLTTSARLAEELEHLALRAGTVTGVGFQRRYLFSVRKLSEILKDQTLGRPLLVRARLTTSSVYSKSSGWRFAPGTGGVTMELGIHLLDILIMLFGEPQRVQALSARMFSENVEDYVSCQLSFPSGLLGSVEIGWSLRNCSPGEMSIEVHFERGLVVASDDSVKLFNTVGESTPATQLETLYASQNVPSLPVLLGSPENVLIDQEFIAAVRGKTAFASDFSQAGKVCRLIDRIRDST